MSLLDTNDGNMNLEGLNESELRVVIAEKKKDIKKLNKEIEDLGIEIKETDKEYQLQLADLNSRQQEYLVKLEKQRQKLAKDLSKLEKQQQQLSEGICLSMLLYPTKDLENMVLKKSRPKRPP